MGIETGFMLIETGFTVNISFPERLAYCPRMRSREPGKPLTGVRAVAAVAGLSPATVSRVINNSTQVSAATRDRVLIAMNEVGFSPDPAARALSTRRTRTIAAVIPTVEHSIFATFLSSLEEELLPKGYGLVIGTTENDAERELARVKAMLNMGAEALLLTGASHAPDLLDLLAVRNVPVICNSIIDTDGRFPTIGYDNFGLGAQAMRFLRERGHQSIAVVHGPEWNNDRTVLRMEGIKTEIPDELAGQVKFVCANDVSVEGGARAVDGIQDSGWQPTAMLCLSDVLALGALFSLRRHNLDVPKDVSVMGFDDIAWAAVCEPPLTSISLPTVEMGRATAEALINRLEAGIEIQSYVCDAAIVERGSVACLKNKT